MGKIALPETRYALSGDVNIAYELWAQVRWTSSWSPASFRTSNSCMNLMDILHSYVAFPRSPALLLSTSEVKVYPIESPARPRLSSAWMTFVPSWKPSVRSTLQ